MLSATSQVKTDKASRYLKALCNHFDRKVQATYNDNHGDVQFGFGNCQMDASDDALSISIQAEDAEHFDRVKHVIADHLIRFAPNESLQVEWVDQS